MAYDKSRGLSPFDFDEILAARLGSSGIGKNRDSWDHGQKDVAAAGTAEQLIPDLAVPDGFQLVIRAKLGNAGDIYLGNSKANAEDVAKRLPYSRGNGLTLAISNANLVWVDAFAPGEGVDYWLET